MRLTAEEHPEAIKRYAHVARAAGWRADACGSRLHGGALVCTRPRGHSGPHVAHGGWRRVLAVWDEPRGGGAPRAARVAEPPERKRGPRDPIGLRFQPRSVPRVVRDWVVGAVSSAEEITFLAFFLAFAGFALYWLRLILG